MIRHSLALFLSLAAAPVAGEISLISPVDCTLGETCFLQQYVDRDPGPGLRDYACGTASYDGHKGTDFALPSIAAMQAGVTVRAAAPGTIRGVRDGMADRLQGHDGSDLGGRDCGNGVVIDHGQGWETQYCHMARGSVAVEPGQTVAAGDTLGRIGMSGRTEFPHLHIGVRRDGTVIDPFRPETPGCGIDSDPLWQDAPEYDPGGLISAGFATAIPDYDAIKRGDADQPITVDAPALVLWAYFYRAQAGDLLQIEITGPDGPVHETSITIDRSQAQAFRASGRRVRAALSPGLYTGRATLTRGGRELDRLRIATTVEN